MMELLLEDSAPGLGAANGCSAKHGCSVKQEQGPGTKYCPPEIRWHSVADPSVPAALRSLRHSPVLCLSRDALLGRRLGALDASPYFRWAVLRYLRRTPTLCAMRHTARPDESCKPRAARPQRQRRRASRRRSIRARRGPPPGSAARRRIAATAQRGGAATAAPWPPRAARS